jgi:Diaminopimelate decarboxylase
MSWWENEFLKVKENKLYLEGRPAEKIAREYGTPVYVYSRKQILRNFQDLKEAFASAESKLEVRLAYAMKANPHPGILKLLLQAGAFIDAVSPAEVEAALKAGFPEEKIMFTGTSISQEDFEQVLRHPGVTVNIDAYEQIEILEAAYRRLRLQDRCRFRCAGIRASDAASAARQ